MDVHNRRRVINAKVDQRARLRLLMPFAILVGAVSLLAVSLHSVIKAISETYSRQIQSQGPEIVGLFHQLMERVERILIVDIGLIGTMALVLWAFYSLKIFGPQVAIHRHIQALISHDYKARIRLRRFDEFTDLAAQLNVLAETLQERDKMGHT